MNEIDLELITTAAQQGNSFSITGIPHKVWDIFREVATEAMPEKGSTAWSSFLLEFITSHLDQKENCTYIMTDIPRKSRDIFDRVCREAGMSADAMIACLFMSSMQGTFHLINMGQGPVDEDDPTPFPKTVVITGLLTDAWSRWSDSAKEFDLTPEQLLGMLFQGMSMGTIQFSKHDDFEPPKEGMTAQEYYEQVKQRASTSNQARANGEAI